MINKYKVTITLEISTTATDSEKFRQELLEAVIGDLDLMQFMHKFNRSHGSTECNEYTISRPEAY